MLKRLLVVLLLMGFAAPALANHTSRANELMVEAVKLLQSAEGATDAAERLRLSEEALGNLNEIVDRYPVKPPFYVPFPDRVSGTGDRMFRVRRT